MRLKGFTLIELLIVIGILAVLLAITLIAINPARQFSQANNTKRTSDINAILNAINQYMVDNRGQFPAGISLTTEEIRATGGVDLCSALVPTYIAALPVDPLTNGGNPIDAADCTTDYETGYEVSQMPPGGNSRIHVTAPDAELGATIEVTR